MTKKNGFRNIANITFSINVAVPEQVFVEIEKQTKTMPLIKAKHDQNFNLQLWSENIKDHVANLLHAGDIDVSTYNALLRGADIVDNRYSKAPCARCYVHDRIPRQYPDFATWLKHIAVGRIKISNIGPTRCKRIGKLV